jgi:hypothetical protein
MLRLSFVLNPEFIRNYDGDWHWLALSYVIHMLIFIGEHVTVNPLTSSRFKGIVSRKFAMLLLVPLES